MTDITDKLKYVYVTIPKEYVCVYHRILAMLADYGEEMLKDCKASCTDKNSGVIECFNMFNAAVAASKLSKTFNNSSTGELEKEKDKYEKLADTIIKYVKAKINQIYHNKDNSTAFVFPVDENGEIKAFVSCDETVKFEVDDASGELIAHKYGDGVEQHFSIADEDYDDVTPSAGDYIRVSFTSTYENTSSGIHPCINNLQVLLWYIANPYDDVSQTVSKEIELDNSNLELTYYYDDEEVVDWDAINVTAESHTFTVVAKYKGLTDVVTNTLTYSN